MFVNLEKIEPKKCPSCPSESMGYAALSPGKGQHTPLFFLSFVDHSQIVQLECMRSGIWGTKSMWGRIVTYKD